MWHCPPCAEGESQRIVADILGHGGQVVGTVTLVWPTEEVMKGTA